MQLQHRSPSHITPVPAIDIKPKRKGLVARWDIENNTLVCRWIPAEF